MAKEIPGFGFTKLAGADLSSAQYRAVKESAGSVVLCSAKTDRWIGIVQNKPANGQAATIVNSGIVLVEAGEALTVGSAVTISTTGRALATGAVAGTDTLLGWVQEAAGAAGQYIGVLLAGIGTRF